MADAQYLTTHDAARVLDLTPPRVRQLADAGRLKTIRTASGWRLFDRQDVEQLARERAARREARA